MSCFWETCFLLETVAHTSLSRSCACANYSSLVPTQSNWPCTDRNNISFLHRFRACKIFLQEFFVSSGDVTRVVPSVGGGAGSRFSCVVLQTERPARHPATHLLIFSDEDFYLRLILYSFQPACIVSLQPPSPFPRQPGWSQPCRQHSI